MPIYFADNYEQLCRIFLLCVNYGVHVPMHFVEVPHPGNLSMQVQKTLPDTYCLHVIFDDLYKFQFHYQLCSIVESFGNLCALCAPLATPLIQ